MICITCDLEKPDSLFYKGRRECKECTLKKRKKRYSENKEQSKAYQKKRRQDIFNNQGGYVVYYIPEHHYVGMTNNISKRINDHRKNGKITDGYEIVGSYKTAIEAHYVETYLHLLGYEGFSYKGGWRKLKQ